MKFITAIFLLALFIMSEAKGKRKGRLARAENSIVAINGTMGDLKKKIEAMQQRIEEVQACGCGPGCPDGWSEFQESCFLYVGEQMGWQQAMDNCHSLDGYLAEPVDQEIDEFLVGFVKPYGADIEQGPWMGLSDAAEEGQWAWDSSKSLASYSNWNAGEPNGDTGDNCMHYWFFHTLRWNDAPCDHLYPSVCQMSKS